MEALHDVEMQSVVNVQENARRFCQEHERSVRVTDHVTLAAELLLALGLRNDFNTHENTKGMLKDTITEAEVIDSQINSVKKSGLAFSTTLQGLGERGRTIQQWILSCPLQEHRYKTLRMLPATSELSGIHRVAWDGLVLSPEDKEGLRIATLRDQDHAGDPVKWNRYAQDNVFPMLSRNFLDEANPLHCIKPRLNMHIVHEEFSISFANEKIHLFAMCHLVNTLQQLGLLKIHWLALEEVMELHVQTLFAGNTPTKPEELLSRFLLATGVSGKTLGKLKRQRSTGKPLDISQIFNPSTKGKKSWNMATPALLQIIREHFNGTDEDLITTLYKLDREMVRLSERKGITSFIDDLGAIAFLDELEEQIPAIFDRLQVNYLGLTCESSDILQEIAAELSSSDELVGPARSKDDWDNSPYYGFEVTLSVLVEQDKVHQIQESSGQSTSEPNPTPVTDVALKKIERFLKERVSGS